MAHAPGWPAAPSFTTPRLFVRPWRRADLDAMAAWPPFGDPLDSAWNWPGELQSTAADLLFWIRSSDPQRRELTITRREEVIGYLSMRQIDRHERSSRLGIGLGAPYVGQGYGSEALRAFVELSFAALGLGLLRLDVAAHNTRALRTYRRLGFRELRRRWQGEGPAEAYAFLAAARYDALRRHFRVRDGRMLVEVIEMGLTKC